MQLAFYSGENCSLCDIAKNMIESDPVFNEYLDIRYVDVKTDTALYHLYGARIPVIKRLDNNTELNWPFNKQALVVFLK